MAVLWLVVSVQPCSGGSQELQELEAVHSKALITSAASVARWEEQKEHDQKMHLVILRLASRRLCIRCVMYSACSAVQCVTVCTPRMRDAALSSDLAQPTIAHVDCGTNRCSYAHGAARNF